MIETLTTLTGETINYDDVKHKYTTLDGKLLIGASSYAKQFGKPFNREAILTKTASSWGVDKNALGELWDINGRISNEFGSSIHTAMEAWFKHKDMGARIASHKGHEHNYALPKNVHIRDIVLTFAETFGDMQGIPEALVSAISLRMAGRIDLIHVKGGKVCRIGDYKGLAIDTPIPTPNGFRTMGNLKEGDMVYGRNGLPCKILHKSSTHKKRCYEVIFNNGTSVIADFDHRWKVVDGDGMNKTEMIETIKETKDLSKGMRIFIAKPIIGEKKELPIDPYLLGVWLGDGNKYGGTLSFPNQDIWDEIVSRGYILSKNYDKITRRVFGLGGLLKSLNLIKNKHIPDIYITSSFEQRLDLLRGLFDSDGYWNKTRNRAVMQTTQPWQRDATVSLLSSLGIKASIHEHVVRGFGLIKTGWSIDFSPSFNPFLKRNHGIPIIENIKTSDIYYVKSVEEVTTVPTQCIEVDSEDHMYLFGYNYIPTHNTNNELDSDKILKYQNQLSFYACILKHHGWTVEGLDIYHHDGKKWTGIPLDVLPVVLSTPSTRPPVWKGV